MLSPFTTSGALPWCDRFVITLCDASGDKQQVVSEILENKKKKFGDSDYLRVTGPAASFHYHLCERLYQSYGFFKGVLILIALDYHDLQQLIFAPYPNPQSSPSPDRKDDPDAIA